MKPLLRVFQHLRCRILWSDQSYFAQTFVAKNVHGDVPRNAVVNENMKALKTKIIGVLRLRVIFCLLVNWLVGYFRPIQPRDFYWSVSTKNYLIQYYFIVFIPCCLSDCKNGVSTVGGNAQGACCNFPFIYQGAVYWACTDQDAVKKWCSTTKVFEIEKKWGFCT